nr:hypothetical protein [Tanacetum cinerariifolium]
MHTRSSLNLPGESSPNPTSSNPKRRNRRRSKQPFILEESRRYDGRSMYYGGIATCTHRGLCRGNCGPPILVEQFKLKHSLINMMTSDQFFRLEKDNPHDRIHWFNKITSTIKYKDVPNSAIKLMLFPFSLTGAARRWLEKETPHSILTWEDLAWDRYKDLLRACPHHGFTELHQLDTFYNALNPADQVSLNSAAGGNLLERSTQDVLTIIENKSKVHNSQNKSIVSQVKSSDANSSSSSEIAKLTHALNHFVKAIEEICVTCGGVHPYYQCLAANGNTFSELRDNIQGYVSAAAVNYNQAITTRSGIVLDGPSIYIPPPFINPDEDERKKETLTDLELAIILKKLPEKLRDPGKFIILCGFSELKCKALADLGASINLIPLSVWKKLDSSLILGRPLLWTTRALIDVHGEEIILHDGDERLTLNMRHDNLSYSNQPQKESINIINIYDDSCEDFLEDLFAINHQSGSPTFSSHTDLTSPEVKDDIFDPEGDIVLDSTKDLPLPHNINPLSGSTTSSSLNHLLEEFADELALITFPPGNDDLPFDIESDLKEIEYLLNHDPIKEIDSILKDSVDEDNLANLNDNLSDTEYAYDDPFDSKGEKIKESKLLIDELDLHRSSDFFPSPEYDSSLFEDFSEVDALPSTNNEDKVFNPGILIQENLSKNNVQATTDGFCSLCNSRNSCVYDPNPNSFDCPPDSCHPPHPINETYSCDSYGNDSHFGYDCQPQFPLNYESEPGYIENYNSYPYDSSSFPQQYPCCEDCEVLSEADHCQPPQYTVNHLIFNAHNDLLNANNDLLNSQNKITIAQNKLMEQLKSMCAMILACCDDDDDDSVITPNEPVDSLSMEDEHLNIIPATELDEFIKSSVENLSQTQSLYDEDVPEKIFLNPLFEEEIIPMKIDQYHHNIESALMESLHTHDSSLIISSKIDSLLDEFAGELTLPKSILPGIDETDCDPEEYILLIERLLYDNSSPLPLEEFVFENSNAKIESFSPSLILIKDSDSFMEEIDLSFNPDNPMPPGIEEDDDDSERDILILEELLDNYSISFPVIESCHLDIPSFSRPPAKPPDGNTGILNIKMMGDNSKQKVPIPGLTITRVSNQEKSPDLLSHQGLETFQPSAKFLMMIHGKNIPILDVSLFHFYPPLINSNMGGIGSSSAT